jgi:hypothetical protein
MFLHGCNGSSLNVHETTVRWGGFLDYAASNDMIVFFPQNDVHRKKGDTHQCWSHYILAINDWNFNNKKGIQNKAFKKLFDRSVEPRDPDYDYLAHNIAKDGPNM